VLTTSIGNAAVWDVGTVNSGDSATLDITVTIDAQTGGQTITNNVTATMDQTDNNSTPDDLTEDITVSNDSDITLTKTVDVSEPNEGDNVTYTITVTNNGPTVLTNLVVTDVLPAGLTLVSTNPSTGPSTWANPNWTVGLLTPTTTETIEIIASVDAGTNGSTITNTVTHTQDQTDTNSTTDDLTEDITVVNDEITAIQSLTYARPTGLAANQYVAEFVFTITNTGDRDVTGISLVDDFAGQNPAITSIDNVTSMVNNGLSSLTVNTLSTGFIYTPTGNVLSTSSVDLTPSENVTITSTVTFTIDPVVLGNGFLVNIATAGGAAPDSDALTDITDNADGALGSDDDPVIIRIDPSGIIYDSSNGNPIAGAFVQLADASNTPLPAVCLVPGQQSQTTTADGAYRFDIIPNTAPVCPTSLTEYRILVTPPAGYGFPSTIIPVSGAMYNSIGCPAPATLNNGACEIGQATPPAGASASGDFDYFFNFLIDSSTIDIIYNNIPMDPANGQQLTITKTANKADASIGDIITYTLKVANTTPNPSPIAVVRDSLPRGIKYIEGSAKVDGTATEPTIQDSNLDWNIGSLSTTQTTNITFNAVLGSDIPLGKTTNFARVFDTSGNVLSNMASHTLEVQADPTFDCSDVIGKVFDDLNNDGYQDKGEPGLAGIKLATARGLNVRTDVNGRYHITCAMIPRGDIGSNFIIKLDEDSLPQGYKVTSENPRVVRLTKGKMVKANFGASKAEFNANTKQIELQVNNKAFVPGTNKPKAKLVDGINNLVNKLQDKPTLARIIYHKDKESAEDVDERIKTIERVIKDAWEVEKKSDLQFDIKIIRRRVSASAWELVVVI